LSGGWVREINRREQNNTKGVVKMFNQFIKELTQKIYDEVEGYYKVSEIKDNLFNIPAKIAELQRKAKSTEQQLEEIIQQIGQIEAEVMFEITNTLNIDKKEWEKRKDDIVIRQSDIAKNGKAKPRFSNAESRKAELVKRLKVRKDYIALQHQKSELETTKSNHEIETDRLRRTFQANMKLVDLVAAEMNLYKLKEV
jgi:hypothetical protein